MTEAPSPASPARRCRRAAHATRRRLLEAAESVFAEFGYHDASIVKITEAAGVGQGTFYLYFAWKKEIFDELVLDLNHRVRQAMTEAAAGRVDARGERASRLHGVLPVHRRASCAVPGDPPGGVRLARDPPPPLRAADRRLRRGLRQAMARGEIAQGDPEVLAWALMGIGELVGMRWILWAERDELSPEVFDELAAHHPPRDRRDGGRVRAVGLAATAAYLPERWMTAAEVADASGIPEDVIVTKFGLRGKHIAAADEHVSDLAVKAASALARGARRSIRRRSTWSCTTARRGRTTRSGRSAPWIAHRLGCANAYAVEYDNVSMGTPVALRAARALLVAEPEWRTVLLVAACRESYLLDYANERSRFMFNFGDGAVAGLLVGRRGPEPRARLARDHGRVVRAAGEGAGRRLGRAAVDRDRSRAAATSWTSPIRPQMKNGLDDVSLRELRRRGARRRRAIGRASRGRLVPLWDPHEAVDARRDRGRSSGSIRPTRLVPRRHRAHERRRSAARSRSRRARRASGRGDLVAVARGRDRLHVGGDGAPVGAAE